MQLSNSIIKAYLECPEAADQIYRLRRHTRGSSEAQSRGSLIDGIVTKGFRTTPEAIPDQGLLKQALASSYGDGNEHIANLLLKRGEYSAAAKRAIRAANKLLNDPVVANLLDGAEFQRRIEFDYLGSKWHGDIDILTRPIQGTRYLLDLKKPCSIEPTWAEIKTVSGATGRLEYTSNRKVPWYDAWDYWMQLALYRIGLGDKEPVKTGILYATDEDPSNVGMVLIEPDPAMLERIVKPMVQLIRDLEAGKPRALPRCGVCDWCRGTSKVSIPPTSVSPVYRYEFLP